MRYYAPERISSRRSRTPEGYLLIEGTPIARCGVQDYGEQELGGRIAPGPDGVIHVMRKPEEVFRPEAIASYNGKSLANDHPEDLIRPGTWRDLTLGVIMNPRRGEGDSSDLLLADILVTDPEAMRAIDDGKVELSGGYNADYVETGPGKAEQVNIIGNHVALVDQGRCGSRCAIGDRNRGDSNMTLRERLMKRFKEKVSDVAMLKALDEAVEAEAKEDGEGECTHIHLHDVEEHGSTHSTEGDDPIPGLTKRIDALEGMVKPIHDWVIARKTKDEKEEEEEKKRREGEGKEAETAKELEEETSGEMTGDAAIKATDSAGMATAWQATIAAAEILVPGINKPTFDRAAKPKATLDALCSLRRKALDVFYLTADGRQIVDDVLRGHVLDTKKMTCAKTRDAFFAASAAKKRSNNGASTSQASGDDRTKKPGHGAINTVSDLAARAKEIYADKRNATTH